MRIGIDIDDTITKTHECVVSLKKTYLPEYNPNLKLPDDVFVPFIESHERDIHKHAELKDGAKEALEYLHAKGHTIIILSSRGSYYKNITEDTAFQDTYDYFIKNNLPFDKIITNLEEKVSACLENKIDLFIDDNIKVCKSVKDAGIKVVKMARFDDLDNDLETVENWNELIKMIKEMN